MAQGTAVADERRARATARYVRMTPMKVRRVVDLIRGMEAREALSVLQFAPQAASAPVAKAAPAKKAPAKKAAAEAAPEKAAKKAAPEKAAKKAPAEKAAPEKAG